MKVAAKTTTCTVGQCAQMLRPVQDAIDIIEGKWKIQIIISLIFGSKRFSEISRDLDGITDKMLSKELKELEVNQLIKRTIHDSFPPRVEYSITDHGRSLKKVIEALGEWGLSHRKKILGKK
jgi:DNA-binding HxlR family transcriptional regulator